MQRCSLEYNTLLLNRYTDKSWNIITACVVLTKPWKEMVKVKSISVLLSKDLRVIANMRSQLMFASQLVVHRDHGPPFQAKKSLIDVASLAVMRSISKNTKMAT